MKIDTRKLTMIVSIVVLLFVLISNSIFAATIGTNKVTHNKNLGDADTQMQNIGSKIFTIISNAGVVLSVVVLAILGVKYMLGSVEDRAEYKKTMMPYIIGALLVFSASTIGKIVYDLASKIK